jgi:predicted aspartyl protease
VGAPGRAPLLGLVALVDSGADLSVIPLAAIQALDLPQIAKTRIRGVTGVEERTPVHAAVLELGGTSVLAEVVGWGDEAIVGRDVLGHFVLELNGPRETLTIATPTPPVKRRLKRVR